jgi:Peptidase A4 family
MHRSRPSRRLLRFALVAVATLAFAGVAYATQLPDQVSTNWAGYAAISGPSTVAFAKRFTSVSGTWVQPAATCVPGEPTFSAFWVGLGGYKNSSKALEQIGSEADCSQSGTVSYYVWYEYVPAGPHNIRAVLVNPGDTISATVRVKGERATVTLTDVTTGASYHHTKVMRSPRPDVSAADWIAEAPSNCDRSGCKPLTLTNFGSVTFTAASATSVGYDGLHTGVIDDPDWIYGAINLQSQGQHLRFGGFGQQQQSAASTSTLALTGDGFTVTYGSSSPATGTTGTTGTTAATGTTGPT